MYYSIDKAMGLASWLIIIGVSLSLLLFIIHLAIEYVRDNWIDIEPYWRMITGKKK